MTVLRNGELRFRALAAGSGPLVLLLHGFPDHPASFRHQLPALAAAGYRAVAPLMRGYEPSSQPARPDYTLDALAGDVAAWLADLEADRAHLVGHDWGAAVAYAVAAKTPERVRSLTGIAVPPLLRRPLAPRLAATQARRSWYMGFFQLPRVPERALRRRDWAFVRRLWRDWSPDLAPSDDEWRALAATLARPGVVPAALAYYRHNLRRPVRLARLMGPPAVPSLLVTGADDGCIDTRMFDQARADDFPGGLAVRRVAGAGHWPHLERPDEVNALLLDWLARH